MTQNSPETLQVPRRFQLADGHVEAAIAGHADHETVTGGLLRVQAARQAMTNGRKAAIGD